MAGRFDKKFKRRLRSLFADLKNEGLVTEDDLTLFYWPQTARRDCAWPNAWTTSAKPLAPGPERRPSSIG